MSLVHPSSRPKTSIFRGKLTFLMTLVWKIVPAIAFLTGYAWAATTVPAKRAASPPNIVLITLDTTRADRMGFLGSELGLTPNLDALARQAVVFSRAYAQAPLTPPSH